MMQPDLNPRPGPPVELDGPAQWGPHDCLELVVLLYLLISILVGCLIV